jgi:outer membrane biogenesis lipoprotein LolB
MKKKFTIFVSMLIIVVLLLSACSSTSPPTAPSDTDTLSQ